MRASDGDIYEFIYTPGKWFKIPDFQRPYSWHRENCNTFLEDLEHLIESGKTHFFGSVVYETKGDESIIIDGQQRITTVSLMIVAIYHLVLDDQSLTLGGLSAADIKERFLWNERHTETIKNRVKLRGVTRDAEIFQQIYDRAVDDNNKNSEMYKVYRHFRNYFADKKNLHRYIEALERLKIVKILLDPRDDQPQKIFESINATGRELNNGDKIRNFALIMDDDSIRSRVFNKYWAKIEQRLIDTNVARDDIADFFWRSLVSNCQKEIKQNEVYPEFKKFFTQRLKEVPIDHFWHDALDDLSRYCFLKYYPNNHPETVGKMEIFKNLISRLNSLATDAHLPYLMKILKRWQSGELQSEQVESILSITEAYLVRRGLLGYRTTGLNKFYATLDKNICERKSASQASYEDVYRYMITNGGYQCPPPNELESRLADINFYRFRSGFQNFVLSSYDDKKLPKESSVLAQLGQKDSTISIEHIMPQNLNRDWKTDLGDSWHEIHNKYCNSLANLTLTGYNSEYSNKSFNEKLNAPNGFAQSGLAINRDSVAIYEVFNKEALIDRTNWWLKTIEWLWPYPKSNYKPKTDDDRHEEASLKSLSLSDLSYSKPQAVVFRQQLTETNHWSDVLDVLMDRIYEDDAHLINKLRVDPEVNPEISQHGQDFIKSVSIGDSDWLVNTTSTTNDKIRFLNRVLGLANIDQQDVRIIFSRFKPDEDEQEDDNS